MNFEYIVIDKEGKRNKSFMKADSAAAVATSLRSAGGKPLKITELRKDRAVSFSEKFFSGPKRVTTKELVVFTRQLGTILSAGVLLTDAINTIATDLENKYFSDVLKSVVFHINAGEDLSSSLSYYPSVFSPYYVAIVSAGEAIGRLGDTIGGLATFMEEDAKMRAKFLAAIRYPVFLMTFVFLIVSGIVLFLIPKFKSIFDGAGIQLPLLTRIVVGISNFYLHNFVLVIGGIILIVVVSWQALQTFRIRFMVDYMLLQIPMVGKVIRKALIARFCHTLSMLLEGGVGIIPALALTTKVMGNFFLKYIIDDIRSNIMAGTALSDAMSPHKDMPRVMVKMVAVGEKSGKLTSMLKRIGDYYDEEVETFLNNINSILEPIFIIFIGGIVLVVALALYLPIFQMSSAVH
jgi:type IV pilus assembly protein PilC